MAIPEKCTHKYVRRLIRSFSITSTQNYDVIRLVAQRRSFVYPLVSKMLQNKFFNLIFLAVILSFRIIRNYTCIVYDAIYVTRPVYSYVGFSYRHVLHCFP